MLSDKTEEYLEAIFRLQEEDPKPVSTSRLAGHLNVSPPSATDMIKRLATKKLIDYQPYYGITFTKRGQKEALRLVRRHRLSERFLTDVLGLGWEEVHDEACKYEHIVSDQVEERMEKTLHNPQTCPHGNPIPTAQGDIIEESSVPLSTLKPGDRGTVKKVSEESPELLKYLASLGLIPKVSLRVSEVAPFGGPILVKLKGASYALGREIADKIRIIKKNEAGNGKTDKIKVV